MTMPIMEPVSRPESLPLLLLLLLLPPLLPLLEDEEPEVGVKVRATPVGKSISMEKGC
jgi:hypothetical protein